MTWVSGKTVMVTGANGGIGRSICALLAKQGADVVAVCRTEDQCNEAIQYVRKRAGEDAHVSYEVADLSLHSSILSLSKRYAESERPLHVLVPNHATAPQKRTETSEGLEVQFAANVMGYYWLVDYFSPILERSSPPGSSPSRVVLVASYYAGGLRVDDMEFKKRPYDNDAGYRQSKQANRMLAASFAQKFVAEQKNILVYSCHPGDVKSKLSNSLGFGGSQSGDEGADTPVFLASDESVGTAEFSGRYFHRRKPARCDYSKDQSALQKLWELCENTTKNL